MPTPATRRAHLPSFLGSLTVLLMIESGCTQPRDEEPTALDSGSPSARADTREPPLTDAAAAAPDAAGPRTADAGTAASPDAPPAPPPDAPAPTLDSNPPPPDTAPPKPDAPPPDLPPPPAPPTVAMVAASSAPARLPAGTKVTCLRDSGMASDTCPVFRWNDHTYWALSYIDNRIELDIVAFDRNNTVAKEIAARGTRYIRRITVDATDQSVTFLGQDEGVPGFNPAVTLPWDDLRVFPR